MRFRNPRTERNHRIALKAWLKQADAWDGIALAYHPVMKRMVNMDDYKSRAAEPQMARVDNLPPEYRVLAKEFGDLPAVLRYFSRGLAPEQARRFLQSETIV